MGKGKGRESGLGAIRWKRDLTLATLARLLLAIESTDGQHKSPTLEPKSPAAFASLVLSSCSMSVPSSMPFALCCHSR